MLTSSSLYFLAVYCKSTGDAGFGSGEVTAWGQFFPFSVAIRVAVFRCRWFHLILHRQEKLPGSSCCPITGRVNGSEILFQFAVLVFDVRKCYNAGSQPALAINCLTFSKWLLKLRLYQSGGPSCNLVHFRALSNSGSSCLKGRYSLVGILKNWLCRTSGRMEFSYD